MADHPIPAPARELTEAEHEKLVEQCFQLERAVKDGIKQGRTALWQVAEALAQFDEDRGWVVLGHETVSDWLGDPEIGMARSTYYRLIRVWNEFVIARKVDVSDLTRLDPSKVDVVLPALKAGKMTTKKAVKDLSAMSKSDLRDVYGPPRADPTPPVATPDADGGGPEQTDPTWAEGPSDGMPGADDVIEGEATEVDRGGVATTTTDLNGAGLQVSRELATDLASVMWRVCEEVAPKEKKKMSADLRSEVERVVKLAIDAGLLDV